MKQLVIGIFICMLITCFSGFAQTDEPSEIEQTINEFQNQMPDNLRSYLQPFVDSFGSNLNSGLYHTAKIPQRGLHIYVGIETMVAIIGEDQRAYTALFPDLAGGQVEEKGFPSVFGSKDEKQVTPIPGGPSYTLPGGFDVKMFPIIAPRITVGSLMGTELSFRWVELDLSADFGLLKINGFGLRHSISQYMPLSLIDVCFGFFVQEFQLGRIFKADMGYFGVQASRKLGPLTLYGGLGIEKTQFTLGNDEGVLLVQPITFDSANRGRINAGFCLSVLVLKLHVDYTLGMQNVLTAGFGIGF